MGSTRQPKETVVQETEMNDEEISYPIYSPNPIKKGEEKQIQETESSPQPQIVRFEFHTEPIKTEPLKVEVTTKTETEPIKITSEPLKIELKNEPQKVEVEMKQSQPTKEETNLTEEKAKTEKVKQEALEKVKKAAEKIGE
jgi:hypothetical protein